LNFENPTLVEVADAISARRVTSREVVESCIARIGAWQPRINAFVTVLADSARAAADRADAQVAAGVPLGPLHGVPLAHKDMFFRVSRRSSLGSRNTPPAWGAGESSLLGRLDAAGAIEIGTLNMCEFALGPTGHNAWLGDCRNPWHTDHIACGTGKYPRFSVTFFREQAIDGLVVPQNAAVWIRRFWLPSQLIGPHCLGAAGYHDPVNAIIG
jgi:Asp-tRNA(Asn)/Glu-tRNA(Gln) amidotransferase A subunit family amidase